MNEVILLILVGIFLPLFPLSMIFNALFDRVKAGWLRAALMIVWPLAGLLIINNVSLALPRWLIPLALFTSVLYALRLLSLREVNQWSGFLATSLWALLWLSLILGVSVELVSSFAMTMSAPLVLLICLSGFLEKRFGAAYTGLYGGLAQTVPRFTAILITVIVAAVATPLFPTFFIVFDMVVETIAVMPVVAVTLLFIWLLWSWAGARLVQGLIVGRASKVTVADIELMTMSLYSVVLIALMVSGIYLAMVIL